MIEKPKASFRQANSREIHLDVCSPNGTITHAIQCLQTYTDFLRFSVGSDFKNVFGHLGQDV